MALLSALAVAKESAPGCLNRWDTSLGVEMAPHLSKQGPGNKAPSRLPRCGCDGKGHVESSSHAGSVLCRLFPLWLLLESGQSLKCRSLDHRSHSRPGLESQSSKAKIRNSDKQRKVCGHIRQWDKEKVQTGLTRRLSVGSACHTSLTD